MSEYTSTEEQRVSEPTLAEVIQANRVLAERIKILGESELRKLTMAAMQGLCANPQIDNWNDEDYGISAVRIAKATLAALEKGNE